LLWLFAGLLCASAAQADDPFLMGVHTHLANYGRPMETSFERMQAAGITAVRDDAFWSTTERQPGVLALSADYRTWLREASGAHMKTLMMLGYGNQFYSSDSKPISLSVRAGFTRFIGFTATQLRGKVDFYEIYNEWDLEDPASEGLTDAYIDLVRDTTRQLRAIDPKPKILAGAVTSFGLVTGVPDRLIKAGVLDLVDGLSMHPYVSCEKANGHNTPESWIRVMRERSRHYDQLAGRPVPLYLTEMAWHSTGDLNPCGVSDTLQAAFAARAFLLARTLPAIKGMWWFDLTNDGPDRAYLEHNFGLLNEDLTPKPAYHALQSVSSVVTRYQYLPGTDQQAADDLANGLYRLDFANGNAHVLAAWVTGLPRQVTLQASGPMTGAVKMVDSAAPGTLRMDIEPQWQCAGERCWTRVTLNEFPLLIDTGSALR
jgi:hypothetical protein